MTTHAPARTRLAALAAAALLAATLTACGSDTSTGAGSGGSDAAGQAVHNTQDVSFAQGMVPHHEQALAMADMAKGRQLSAPVAQLVGQIRSAQAPEIAQMKRWLKAWGAPSGGSMSGMGHGSMDHGSMDHGSMDHGSMDHGDMDGMSMPGMMTDQQMNALDQASGKAFERMWLQMMVEHHKGAVTMAEQEIAKGEYGPAVTLAKSIVRSQTAEIATMEKLLG